MVLDLPQGVFKTWELQLGDAFLYKECYGIKQDGTKVYHDWKVGCLGNTEISLGHPIIFDIDYGNSDFDDRDSIIIPIPNQKRLQDILLSKHPRRIDKDVPQTDIYAVVFDFMTWVQETPDTWWYFRDEFKSFDALWLAVSYTHLTLPTICSV